MARQFDILAIGGGAAGLVTAAGAAGLGARAALIERDRMGGECLWTGCIPSKALIAAGRVAALVRGAGVYGVRAQLQGIDFDAVMAQVRAVQQKIAPHDSPERFRALGVEVLQGHARFLDERSVELQGERIEARHIVIATGSRPLIPDIHGLDQVDYHTNETIFELSSQPGSMIVLGGGAIGVELAQAFARLGTQCTIIEAAETLLPREDAELVALLTEIIAGDGVKVLTSRQATRVERAPQGVKVTLDDGSVLEAETLLVAIGRRANHASLDLARAGVQPAANGLLLDDRLQTTAPHIWAAGDVTGAPRFTHVADYQARLVLRNALFPFSAKARYDQVPWVTYTDPELAHLGMTEAEAERRGARVEIWSRPYAQLDRALADGRTHGLVKLIATRSGTLLGAHVLGEGASSLIAQLAQAMTHGLKLNQIASTIHPYPSYPEIIRQTAELQRKAGFTGVTKALVQKLVQRAR